MVRVFVVLRSSGLYHSVSESTTLSCTLLTLDSRKRYRNRSQSPIVNSSVSVAPGVSILRPLKGLEPNLYENLESTFTQEYPNYEIIHSVADECDQALAVVRELMDKYPDVNAQVVVGESLSFHRYHQS